MKPYDIKTSQVGSFHSLFSTETNDKASYSEAAQLLTFIPKCSPDSEFTAFCSDIFDALSKFNDFLNEVYGSFSHGGKRQGAGRPVTNPTKPVRLNDFEQRLISEFRLMNGDTKQNLKRIVKYMAVLELGDIENQSKK